MRNLMMEVSSLLSLPEGLSVEWIEAQGELLSVGVVSLRAFSCCPQCREASAQIHSHYHRQLRDIPCGGRKVILTLSVRKFFCCNPDCPQKIFTERLPTFVESSAQVTRRLFEAIQTIGLATGGELGARLCDHIGFHTSPTTILRRIMALPFHTVVQLSELGIDDWSFRRGRKFGTILVDLTTHTIIDLLPDRNAESAAAWMKKHPEIQVVSRDRGEDYASAARLGAPQAVQCADRFHLAQNLTAIVEVILARCASSIRKAGKEPDSAEEDMPNGEHEKQPLDRDSWHPAPDLHDANASLARHMERADRYQRLLELRSAGLTIEGIADCLAMSPRTVRSWLKQGLPYSKPRRKRQSCFDPYAASVADRWQAGEHNGLAIWREIAAQGYKGSARTLYRFLARLREQPTPMRGKAQRTQMIEVSPLQNFSAKEAVWLFVRRLAALSETEKQTLALIRQACPAANLLYELVEEFMNMLRNLQGDRLDVWLTSARSSHLPELQRFVHSIERDKAAVKTGLSLPHSNGIVEGKVNKLKLIKRMGYGRAGFALLRQRVLHAL
jgi:transposase